MVPDSCLDPNSGEPRDCSALLVRPRPSRAYRPQPRRSRASSRVISAQEAQEVQAGLAGFEKAQETKQSSTVQGALLEATTRTKACHLKGLESNFAAARTGEAPNVQACASGLVRCVTSQWCPDGGLFHGFFGGVT